MKASLSLDKMHNSLSPKGRSTCIITLLCVLFCTQLSAQLDLQSITLPESLRMESEYSMEVFNNNLYVVLEDGSLRKYNGSTFSEISLPGQLGAQRDMKVFDNGLYIGFDSGDLYKYDGSTFSQIAFPGNHRMASEYNMEVHDNSLYIVLEDGSNGIYGQLYKYNGSTLSQIALPASHRMASRYDIEVYDNSLYIVLEDGSNGIYGALYKYNGSTLSQITLPGTDRMAEEYEMEVYNDNLYVVLEGSISGALYKYDGSTFSQIALPGTLRMASQHDMEVYGNSLYIVLEDGSNGIYGALYKHDGSTLSQIALPGTHRMASPYDIEVYANSLYIVLEDGSNGIYGQLYTLGPSPSKPPFANHECGRNILEFESGAYANIGSSITNFSYSSGTIEAWVRKTNWSDPLDDALFSNGIGFSSPNSFYVSFHPVVGLHFRYGGTETGNVAAHSGTTTSTDTLTNNSWHHIAASWHNDGSNTILTTYMDGIEIATASTSTNLILAGGTSFGIGEGIVNSTNDFHGGSIAEFSLWDVARTQEQIQTDLKQLFTGSETNLIGYWPFNDAQGSTTAANLVQSTEEATLLDFTDIPNAWVNFPLEIKVASAIVSNGGIYGFDPLASGESSGNITFTITNNGHNSLDLLGIPISTLTGTDADQFTLDLSGTANTLAANSSTTFTVSFDPSSSGEKNAFLTFTNVDGCSNPYIINLMGEAINDDCASAIPLTVFSPNTGSFTQGSTEFATVFAGSVGCDPSGYINDVWYSFTTGSTGAVEINTTLGTATSLSGAVYLGCGASSVYCVQDLPSKIYLPLGPGVDVYLQFWNSQETAGTFSVRINEAPNTWANAQWSAGEAPSAADDALILSTYITSENGSLDVNNLELVNDRSLYAGALLVDNENYVKINGDLTNQGTILVESGSSLVTFGEVSNVAYEEYEILGTQFFVGCAFERETTFDQNTGRYSIVGSPVQQGSFDSLGTNALIYVYAESSPYNPNGNQGLDRFKTPAQLELLGMTSGKGYFSAFTGDENGKVSFTGTPNFGNLDVALSHTDHSTISGNAGEDSFEGFNLVSNPYPTAISYAAFRAGNITADIDESIYIWDDFGSNAQRGTNADYLIVNATLGNTDSRGLGESKWDGYIRSTQGFFVKANSANQTLHFTDAMKVVGNNTDAGYFRRAPIERYKLVLSDGANRKAMIVGFIEDATTGKDKAYDAMNLSGGTLQLYSLQPEGDQKLAIQGLPLDFKEEIHLGYKASAEGTYTISVANVNELQEMAQVLLKDHLTGTSVNLKEEAYSFTSLEIQDENRFTLQINPSVINSMEDLKEAKPYYTYASNGRLNVVFETNQLENVNFQLTDLTGKPIKSKSLQVDANKYRINTQHLSNSIYILVIRTESNIWKTKVITK